MPDRRFSPRVRQSGIRNPKLIIIATEGKCTEKQYFEELRFRNGKPNIHVEILPTHDTDSSPKHVLERLDEFKKQYKFSNGLDELWMVIDVDSWGDVKIAEIAQLCQQKRYNLAVSNPCFEAWLLLHFQSIEEYPIEEQRTLLHNKREGARTALEKELLRICGEYNKSNLNMDYFIPNIRDAIERSRILDDNNSRWPQSFGTRVYLLVEKIIDSSI